LIYDTVYVYNTIDFRKGKKMENEIDYFGDDDFDSPELEEDDDVEGTTPEQQLKELEATPGFLEGKLRNSQNPDDRQKHEEILKKRSELIKRQIDNEKPKLLEADKTPETQARIRQELENLEATPGFAEGRLRTSSNPADHELHAELMKRRSELISRLLPDTTPAGGEKDQGNLIRQATRDVDELVKKHDYPSVTIPRNISERDVAILHLQLLSARGDFKGFADFAFTNQMKAGFSDEKISELRGLAKLDIPIEDKQKTTDNILRLFVEEKI